MESSGATNSGLRNRSLDTNFGTDCRSAVKGGGPPMKFQNRETDGADQSEGGGYVDDDSWSAAVVLGVKIVLCLLVTMAVTLVWTVILILMMPWPIARIKQGNLCGRVGARSVVFFNERNGFHSHVTMKTLCSMMWILGNPVKIEGYEFSNTRGIYIGNHASPLDTFFMPWLIPVGTVGIAKKEFVWYPFIGQLYVLANQLLVDRSNPTAAIESMNQAARTIVKNNLSLAMFPEGTRSKTGRLLPFKKGFVHMALQSRLPIVPVVLIGTHRAWRTGSFRVRPTPLVAKYLPPIKTDDWTADKVDEYVEMIHAIYVKHLPEDQKP